MDGQLSWQIKCSLCLCDFSDPVALPCEHSYCRQCITGHMQTSLGHSACPECRKPYSQKDLRSSRLLNNITSAVRQHLTAQQGPPSAQQKHMPSDLRDTMICLEHDEKLKLFCETDQKLVCVVCRDGQKHQGHQFKPVKEASVMCKGILKGAIGFLTKENREMENLAQQQAAEIAKTENNSMNLSKQISAQFEMMHQFLTKKEKEIKKMLATEETNAVTTMGINAYQINEKLTDSKETEVIFKSAMEIAEPDYFLQWWYEKGFPVTEAMRKKGDMTGKMYRSKVKDLSVMPHSLFLGPHETHMQFFVWKQMLGAIKPVAESLTIQPPTDTYLKVSPVGINVRQADRQSNLYKSYNPGVVSTETFKNGQHYWEVDVGKKLDWSIGVKVNEGANASNIEKGVHLNLRDGKGYSLSSNEKEFSINLKRNPSKIGLYLDCERKQVSFYDADTMSLIFLSSLNTDLPCSVSLYPGLYLEGKNTDPLSVCSYEFNTVKFQSGQATTGRTHSAAF